MKSKEEQVPSTRVAKPVASTRAAAKALVADPTTPVEVAISVPTLVPPVNPTTKLLAKAGFVFAKAEAVDERSTGYGYTHPEGGAALLVVMNTGAGARWVLSNGKGATLEGKTAQELVQALFAPKVPAHVVAAVRLLQETTKGVCRPVDLTGDGAYTARVRLLKVLRKTDKVLTKDSGVTALTKEFYAALGVPEGTGAAKADAFVFRCANVLRAAAMVEKTVIAVDKAETKAAAKAAPKVLMMDDKPLKPVAKKMTNRARAEAEAETKAALAAKVRRAASDHEESAIFDPKKPVAYDLSVTRVLELPNGNSCLQLEEQNSQGGLIICNNGKRVAACLVLPKDLKTAKVRKGSREVEAEERGEKDTTAARSLDLREFANGLLEPGGRIEVRPAAVGHLKAFLAHLDLLDLRSEDDVTPAIRPPADYAQEVRNALEDVRLLEDPNNGVALLQVEKINSQGAICVYNNGRRVVAGVVPPEIYRILRPVPITDLVRDVNQLLTPITSGVEVTPAALRLLTAVLSHCKENIAMATETAAKTKKFAPPADATKKPTAKVAKTKVARATSSKEHGGAGKFLGLTIKALVKENPSKREGSWTHTMLTYILGSKTTDEATAKLAKDKAFSDRKLDFNWAVNKEYIKLA